MSLKDKHLSNHNIMTINEKILLLVIIILTLSATFIIRWMYMSIKKKLNAIYNNQKKIFIKQTYVEGNQEAVNLHVEKIIDKRLVDILKITKDTNMMGKTNEISNTKLKDSADDILAQLEKNK